MNDIPPDSEDDTTEEYSASNEEVKFALKQVRRTATHAPECASYSPGCPLRRPLL